MKIEHIALYVKDLEKSRDFYCSYFEGKASEIYMNHVKMFSSYFISFDDGSRLELMHQRHRDHLIAIENLGLHHFAFSVGSKELVDIYTEKLRINGFKIAGEPRLTGDGYYESIVLDPDGNLVEITA
jgi:lactoylglutathione lyase